MYRSYLKLRLPQSYFTEKVLYVFMYWNLYTTMTKRAFLLSLLRNKTDLWTCFCSGDHRGISLSKHSSTCHPHNEYHPNKNKKNVENRIFIHNFSRPMIKHRDANRTKRSVIRFSVQKSDCEDQRSTPKSLHPKRNGISSPNRAALGQTSKAPNRDLILRTHEAWNWILKCILIPFYQMHQPLCRIPRTVPDIKVNLTNKYYEAQLNSL